MYLNFQHFSDFYTGFGIQTIKNKMKKKNKNNIGYFIYTKNN